MHISPEEGAVSRGADEFDEGHWSAGQPDRIDVAPVDQDGQVNCIHTPVAHDCKSAIVLEEVEGPEG